MGASVLLLPLLRFLLALRGARAAGTALAVTFFAALTGLLSYGTQGDVHGLTAILLAVGQVGGALWGQRLLVRFPSAARLQLVWAAFLTAIGLLMIASARGLLHIGPSGSTGHLFESLLAQGPVFWIVTLVLAVLIGLVSQIMTVGGVLLVPAAIFVLHLTPEAAQGTALLVLLLASLPGLLIHASRGDVDPQPATWMSVGAVFGTLVGAFYASQKFSPDLLMMTYGIALILVGFSLLWRKDDSTQPSEAVEAPRE